ncbi:MAG: hypothetical protein P8X65_06345 [Syntrophobacterales bacterium]|jgi:hypothetical protein
MKKVGMFLLTAVLVLAIPALVAAQMHGGQGQRGQGQHMMGQYQYMMGPGMTNNFGMMSGIMGEMHQMMQSGQLTPGQQQQMLKWMNQMGGMMQQWGGPQGAQLQAQHQQQLRQMQQQLQQMRGQMQRK